MTDSSNYVQLTDFTVEVMDSLTPGQLLHMNPIPLPAHWAWQTIGGHKGAGTWRNRTVGAKPNPNYGAHSSNYYVDHWATHLASKERRNGRG